MLSLNKLKKLKDFNYKFVSLQQNFKKDSLYNNGIILDM